LEKCSARREISASFMPFTIGCICGAGRSSSRISTSWFSMKVFG
jgi:hypothetical protein